MSRNGDKLYREVLLFHQLLCSEGATDGGEKHDAVLLLCHVIYIVTALPAESKVSAMVYMLEISPTAIWSLSSKN